MFGSTPMQERGGGVPSPGISEAFVPFVTSRGQCVFRKVGRPPTHRDRVNFTSHRTKRVPNSRGLQSEEDILTLQPIRDRQTDRQQAPLVDAEAPHHRYNHLHSLAFHLELRAGPCSRPPSYHTTHTTLHLRPPQPPQQPTEGLWG